MATLIARTASSSFMDTSLPDLLPLSRTTGHGAELAATAAAGGCAAVNRTAIEAAIAAIVAALGKADENVTASGDGVPGARYPAAAMFAKDGCRTALGTMETLLAWLEENDLFDPPDGRVTNRSASFNVAGYCREAIIQLHFARHWASVSSGSNASIVGRECTELLSDALAMIEPLSANATSCYLRDFV